MVTYTLLTKHKTLEQAKKEFEERKKKGIVPLITYEKGKFRVYKVTRARKQRKSIRRGY